MTEQQTKEVLEVAAQMLKGLSVTEKAVRAILELVRADETVEAEAHSAAWREFLEQHPELKDEEDLGD